MNALKNMVQVEITQAVETMTSLDIVDLINKGREVEANGGKWTELAHSDFMKKVPIVLGLGGEGKFSVTYLDKSNRQSKCYELPERETMLMLMSYSYDLQAAVYDHLQELKAKVQHAIPQTLSEALLLAGQIAAHKEKALEELEVSNHKHIVNKPKVEHYDTVVDKDTLMNATQVGAKVGISAIKLNRLLVGLNVYNRTVHRSKVFNLWFVDKGYGETKQTLDGYTQSLFTTKGEAWIIEHLYRLGEIKPKSPQLTLVN